MGIVWGEKREIKSQAGGQGEQQCSRGKGAGVGLGRCGI